MELDKDISRNGKDYSRKIKTRDELVKILGPRPREKSVIMCHGTFDIVHPGHIRHLMYCSEKADVLLVSITSDKHINKANFRPYIPEQLRAMNLAALEVVDYVVVDSNPTSLENLGILQPDYFAKGYDYSKDGIHPKTKEESDVIESYGGELIFTPGDIVYSSSAIIETKPPNLVREKLEVLMKAEGITFNDLRNAIHDFHKQTIHVVGDTIVDSYTHCSLIGGGTKTPTLSVKKEESIDYSGGAAVVSKHIRSAGAKVHFSTILGNDELKNVVLKDLEESGVECSAVIDKSRPTTNKNVFICKGHRLLKVDSVDNRAVSEKTLAKLEDQIKNVKADGVVFSDFRHGIFSQSTIPGLISAIPRNCLKVADSQVASRWGNILEFRGFDLITPNEREARFALGDQDSVVRPLALNLMTRAEAKYLIMKMGERGVIGYRNKNDLDPRAFFTVDSFAEKVVDPVGAGDALLAYATLCLLTTQNIVVASIIGSMAASIVCAHDGNNPVPPSEVLKVIDLMEKRAYS